MDNVIDFKGKNKDMDSENTDNTVTNKQLAEFASMLLHLKEIAEMSKDNKKEANAKMQEYYSTIAEWMQVNKITQKRIDYMMDALPNEVTEGFNIVGINSIDCQPFIQLYGDDLEIIKQCSYYLKSDKNDCRILLDGEIVQITSFGKIDLNDEKLNKFLNLYELNIRLNAPKFSMSIVVCEDAKTYSVSSNNMKISKDKKKDK